MTADGGHHEPIKAILVVNPSNDRVFVEFAQTLVDHGVPSIDEFERRVQLVYPRAAVHARLLAAEPILIWYVYRDGRWIDPRTLIAKGVSENDA